ncbi:MAG: aminotransferase class IV [bacterium]
MYRFIETIKLEDGNFKLIDYHNKRLNKTILHFFKKTPVIDIGKFLPLADAEFKKGLFKCRIVYSDKIESIEIMPYTKKNIKRLKIVRSNIYYCFKNENRNAINDILYNAINNFLLEKESLKNKNLSNLEYAIKSEDVNKSENVNKNESDIEILIVKNGLITDTSYSNVILYDGKEWFTPKSFILNGVKRQYLLNTGKIKEIKITLEDLKNFEKISLINAMLEPQDIEIGIENISE